MRKRLTVCVTVLVMAGTSGAFMFWRPHQGVVVATTVAVEKPVTKYVTPSTTPLVKAKRQVELGPLAGGKIACLYIEKGQAVRMGEKLVQMENGERRLLLEEKRVRAQKAEADYRRNQGLFATGDIPKVELEESKFQYELADNALQKAEKDLRDTEIWAPFDGVVADIYFEEGETLNAANSQPLLTLIDRSGLSIAAGVHEVDVPQVKVGQAAEIEFEAAPGEMFSGRVERIAEAVRSGSGQQTYEVTIAILNPPVWVRPGMSAEVRIAVLHKSDALLIPTACLLEKGDQSYVYTLQARQAKLTPVQTGISTVDAVEISSGLAAGDTVIVAKVAELEDGTAVQVGE